PELNSRLALPVISQDGDVLIERQLAFWRGTDDKFLGGFLLWCQFSHESPQYLLLASHSISDISCRFRSAVFSHSVVCRAACPNQPRMPLNLGMAEKPAVQNAL